MTSGYGPGSNPYASYKHTVHTIYMVYKSLKSFVLSLLPHRIHSIERSKNNGFKGWWELWIEMDDASTLQTLKDIQDIALAMIAKERLLDIPRDRLETRIRDPIIKIHDGIPCVRLMLCADLEEKLTTRIFQKNAEGTSVEITSPTNTPLDILKPGAIIRSVICLGSMSVRKDFTFWNIIWSLKLEQALLVTPAPYSPPLPCIGRVTDPTLLTDDVCHLTYDDVTLETAYLTQCGHLYERENLYTSWKTKGKKECPYCKAIEPFCPCPSCK
jgi:hypothetical protein